MRVLDIAFFRADSAIILTPDRVIRVEKDGGLSETGVKIEKGYPIRWRNPDGMEGLAFASGGSLFELAPWPQERQALSLYGGKVVVSLTPASGSDADVQVEFPEGRAVRIGGASLRSLIISQGRDGYGMVAVEGLASKPFEPSQVSFWAPMAGAHFSLRIQLNWHTSIALDGTMAIVVDIQHGMLAGDIRSFSLKRAERVSFGEGKSRRERHVLYLDAVNIRPEDQIVGLLFLDELFYSRLDRPDSAFAFQQVEHRFWFLDVESTRLSPDLTWFVTLDDGKVGVVRLPPPPADGPRAGQQDR